LQEAGSKSLAEMEEFVAVLMRLRLGLLLEDVADRFAISPTTMSKIFMTRRCDMSKQGVSRLT